MDEPPPKPTRPVRDFSIASNVSNSSILSNNLKVNPTTSVSLDTVVSPHVNNQKPFIQHSQSSQQLNEHLSGNSKSPVFNAFSPPNEDYDDVQSQVSIFSKTESTIPILTINNTEEDQLSIMENELEELINDNKNSLTDDIHLKDSLKNYQIFVDELVDKLKIDNLDGGFSSILKTMSTQTNVEDNSTEADEINLDPESFFKHNKHLFILSSSGKPIYSLFGPYEQVINYMSIIQTLISSFKDTNDDNLKTFVAGNFKFMVLNKNPIYLLSISNYQFETTVDLQKQLYIVYNYLISIISKKQMLKFFQMKLNFDLRKILNDSDFDNMSKIMLNKFYNPGFVFDGIESCYLSTSTKMKLNSIISKNKDQNCLFSILADGNGKILTILKPKHHFLHTTDLQILSSIIFDKDVLKQKIKILVDADEQKVDFTNEEDLWFPICLPDFNSNGFMYCFMNYVDLNNLEIKQGGKVTDTSTMETSHDKKLVLILLSPNKNSFFEIRDSSQKIISQILLNQELRKKMDKSFNILSKMNYSSYLKKQAFQPLNSANLFYHFIFKSKKNSQIFVPSLNSLNLLNVSQITYLQLMTLYRELYTTLVVSTSSLNDRGPIGFVYMNWSEHTNGLLGIGYGNTSYEFYLILKPGVNKATKKQLVETMKIIVNWIFKNFNRLFIMGSTF